MKIRIRLVDSLGCSVAGSAVIYSIIEEMPKYQIILNTIYPTLFKGIKQIKILIPDKEENDYEVDLRKYTSRKPHSVAPYKPSYVHMIEMAEEQLGINLPRKKPILYLEQSEIDWAKKEISRYGKPVIWIQTKSNSNNRHWPKEKWRQLIERNKENYTFLDLSNIHYSLRESLSITKVSYGGVALDSFLLHGSAAVDASNVVALLGSSNPVCVSYPKQKILYKSSSCAYQPCGMHGYVLGCRPQDEFLFLKSPNNLCLKPTFECMEAITIEEVENSLLL